MDTIDRVRQLLADLAEAFKNGASVFLSEDMALLLTSAIDSLADESGAVSALRFQVVLGNDDGEGPATLLGAASTIEVALATLEAAEKQNPERKIRLYDQSVIPEEAA